MKSIANEDDAKPSRNYPDGVLTVSALIREAAAKVGEGIDDEGKKECDDDDDEALSDADTLTSSGSSTPIGSPSSSISQGRHICGSLFAKCGRHGRSPLLETFTDTGSYLSQQTFSMRHRQQRTDAFDKLFHKAKIELSACQTDSGQSKSSEPRRVGELHAKGDGDGSKLPSNPVKSEGDSNFKIEPQIKPLQRLLVRRHNSLPNKHLTYESLYAIGEIFAGENDDDRRKSSDGEEDDVAVRRSLIRGRSKSDGKIGRRIHGLSSDISDSGSKHPKSGRIKSNQTSSSYANNFESPRFGKSVSYYLLDSPCEHLEPTISNRHKCPSADCSVKYRNRRCSSSEDETALRVNLNCPDVRGDADCLRSVITQLKKENMQWSHKVDFLETEILLLRRELKKRDKENLKLQREVSKLRSVLHETSIFRQEDILSSLQDSHGMPGQIQQIIAVPNPNKKQGVSGESSDNGRKLDQIEIQRFDKDFRSKQLIKGAIMENDYLKNLDSIQVREIVESVYPKELERGSYVIKEGEAGSHLYVSAEGEFEVIKDHKILGRMGPGRAFGELAILYNCRRTASIKVTTDAKVWVLDRRVFQQIMMKTGLQRLQENINFLRSVPLLQPLKNNVLAKIADVLEVDFFPSGAHIIRQGASGDTFFIISSGQVKVTQQKPGKQEDEEIRILGKGDYFGEQALLKEDWRTANVIALSPGVECLTLDRESFIQLIGDLSELQEKNYEDQDKRGVSKPSSSPSLVNKEEYGYIRLEDLEVISTLGVGGFGRVELVQYASNKNMTFALKCLKKQHIVDTQQQEHVYSERNIMMACNSPFISRLYRTFRDSKYVYMLLEACLGGEVWTILRERGYFDDYTTRFVTGCVVEAFEYLHARGIIYRDLKPENLLLDNVGYVKIVDFGFSKRIGFSSKTWTFCGTPEYVAPEIILNKGHDRAVDYWSLGILMHELLTGTPPFTAPDPMRTYNIILKGIDMIDFPKHITRSAQSLIKRLCRDSPSERLGYQRGGIEDIKKHKWFQGFDWLGLRRRALGPPITPLVKGPTDASNFDYYSKEVDQPPDEFSNWDAEF